MRVSVYELEAEAKKELIVKQLQAVIDRYEEQKGDSVFSYLRCPVESYTTKGKVKGLKKALKIINEIL